MMQDHFLRCKQSDFPELVSLGKLLGIIDESEGRIYGINGSDWDLVFGNGQLYEGTGVLVDVEGVPTEQKRLIVDDEGKPYLHININVRFDLGDRARELAVNHPELQDALANMGKFFLLDAEGKPRRPTSPQCTF